MLFSAIFGAEILEPKHQKNQESMKQALLAMGLTAIATVAVAQGPFTVGEITPVDFQRDASRGTDTLFTFGVETATGFVNVGVAGGTGYFFGTGSLPLVQFAQEFELIDGPANVDGIVFLFAVQVATSGDPSSHIKARLYDLGGSGVVSTGTAPRPNTVLREVELPITDIVTEDFTGVSFAPEWFSGSFAAGFSLDGIVAGDSVNLAVTESGFVEAFDRSWVNAGGNNWLSVLAVTTDPQNPGGGFNTDYVIGAVLTPSSVSVGESAWMNGMQLDILGGNPTTDGFTVRYAVRDAADIRLYIVDAKGRSMVDERLGRQTGENLRDISTQNWAAGTYFVNVIANGKPITKRVVVQ